MPLIMRLGDTSDHGGAIISAASRTKAEGAFIARVGDILDCPIHGPNPIVEGSPNTRCEGAMVARQGDHTACGAALISGASRTFVNGR